MVSKDSTWWVLEKTEDSVHVLKRKIWIEATEKRKKWRFCLGYWGEFRMREKRFLKQQRRRVEIRAFWLFLLRDEGFYCLRRKENRWSLVLLKGLRENTTDGRPNDISWEEVIPRTITWNLYILIFLWFCIIFSANLSVNLLFVVDI